MKHHVYREACVHVQIVVLSAFLGRDQATTEAKFAADPEFAQWVKKYQDSRETVSQTDYEVINPHFVHLILRV